MKYSDYPYIMKVRDEKSHDGFSGAGDVESGCLVFVYDAGTKTLSTIYADENRTAKANPITRAQFATDLGIKFWSPSTSHDVVVSSSDGSQAKGDGVTPNSHLLKMNRSGAQKVLVAPFDVANGVAEVDTGLDFPRFTLIRPLIIEVVTADSGDTIDVGILSSETNGDADGLALGVSIASAGFIRPWVTTVGSNEVFIATPTNGVLIGRGSAGTDAANDFGQPGGYGHIINASNGTSLSYDLSAGATTGVGYIHCPFQHLR